jgi:hypothetical protein
VIAAGAPAEDRTRQRFEKMVTGMMGCAERWQVVDRIPD